MEDDRADEAYAILKESVNKPRDASTVFGEYVATKHRQYSAYTKNLVEHAINNILFEADMGKYDPSTLQQLTPTVVHPETTPSPQMGSIELLSFYSSVSDESLSSSTQ